MNTVRFFRWILSLIMLAQASTALAEGGFVLASWVELGPEGAVIARAVTTDASCPSIMLDTTSQPMQVRAEPSTDYPVLVCETTIPSGTTSAAIDSQLLPLPKANPQLIVAFGDTGCSIKKKKAQDCNDPDAWPAEQISQSAASEEPDLMIHVGDIIYREDPCPDPSNCGGSPNGYNWDTFNADFFTPQAALLKAAPWVFVRGNHETCDRAGSGWFLFFDPRPMPDSCQDFTDPYTIQAGNLQLQVFDSAFACDNSSDTTTTCDDPTTTNNEIMTYAGQFAALGQLTSENAWFLTHRPVWGIEQTDDGQAQLEVVNETLQAASNNDFPAGVMMILTGHIHLFETLTFDAPRPLQVVVGTGGTKLNSGITLPVPPGTMVADAEVNTFETIDQFGYLVLEQQDNQWQATLRNTSGENLTTFTVPEGSLLEQPPDRGGDGCSIAQSNTPISIPLYLLIPVFIVVRRVWRRCYK